MSRPPPVPETCAHCGAAIPRSARACPDCGADERTGWREASIYDGLDLPEAAWEDEAGKRRPGVARVNGVPWYWWCVGAALLVLLAAGLIGRW